VLVSYRRSFFPRSVASLNTRMDSQFRGLHAIRRDRRHLRKARASSTGSYEPGAPPTSPSTVTDPIERPLHPPPTKLGDPPQRQSSTTFRPTLRLQARRR
jgi:hypothetical protein